MSVFLLHSQGGESDPNLAYSRTSVLRIPELDGTEPGATEPRVCKPQNAA
jgi:hypothetical protein